MLIGVSGANLYGPAGQAIFTTQDFDLFLPPMAGLELETVWNERRPFVIDDVTIPVARLQHIVASKHAAGRDKDRLFLATHREALEQLLKKPEQG